MIFEFRGSDFLNNTYERMMSNDYRLLINKSEVIEVDEKKYLIGFLTAKELLDAIAPMADGKRSLFPDVFKNNIRLYLGRNEINKNIEDTLKREPQNFHLYNNGLTITTKEIKDENSKNYIISPVNIVNGCQTANSIYNVCKDNSFDETKVRIPVKIIVAQDSEYENITIRTNTQNGVEAKDLVSITQIQKELQDKFAKQSLWSKKFYYKRQKSSEIDNMESDYIIQIDDILRAGFSTLMLMPNKVSGYFDKTTLKYVDTLFEDAFIDIYVITTILLKFIEEYLENNYPELPRLKYHILYIIYRIATRENENRLEIAEYFREKDEENTFDEETIKAMYSQLYQVLNAENNFNIVIDYVINTIKKYYPQYTNIIDKKSEKVWLSTSIFSEF